MRVPCLLAALLAATATLWAASSAAAEPWIAVIVPSNAPAEEVFDAERLSSIFRRKQTLGAGGARLQPVNLRADSSLRRRFSRAVLGQSPESLEDYWNQLYFQGVVPPHVLASEAAMLRFVGETRHSIGYLDACLADATVKVILLIDAEQRLQAPTTPVPCGP